VGSGAEQVRGTRSAPTAATMHEEAPGRGVWTGTTYGALLLDLQPLGQGFVADHQGNVVDERLDVLGAGAGRAQLGELRLQARMLRDVGILGESGHGL
jgi:hypothetical protein